MVWQEIADLKVTGSNPVPSFLLRVERYLFAKPRELLFASDAQIVAGLTTETLVTSAFHILWWRCVHCPSRVAGGSPKKTLVEITIDAQKDERQAETTFGQC